MYLRMCAATRSMPGTSVAGPSDPRIGRGFSSVSDTLSDPIPETLSDPSSVDAQAQCAGPFDGDHGHARGPEYQTPSLRDQNLSPEAQLVQSLLADVPASTAPRATAGEVHAGVPRPGMPVAGKLGVLHEGEGEHCAAQLTGVPFGVPEVPEPPQCSHSGVGTVPDMSSRSHCSSGFAASATVDSQAGSTPSRHVRCPPFHADSGHNSGVAIHDRSGVGDRGGQPSHGLSMLTQMFGPCALGASSVDGSAGRGLSVADCVGPNDRVPGHTTRRGNGRDDMLSMTTCSQRLRSVCSADSESHIEVGGSGQPREAEADQAQGALAAGASGYEPPASVQGSGDHEVLAEIMHPPDTSDFTEDGVAPLAAQLAKLYC